MTATLRQDFLTWPVSVLCQVGDARWLSTQSSGLEVLEDLLNGMQHFTDFLKQGNGQDLQGKYLPPPPPGCFFFPTIQRTVCSYICFCWYHS